ncbi:MAG TPA: cytochrome c biogenesis protein CcsA [Minicystis sp.]|nr:cytochrome c biogenesis protein CcsA [Minicystis sp.]
MTELLSRLTFASAALLYAASSVLFYLDIARAGPNASAPLAGPRRSRLAPVLLGAGAVGHAAYVALASFVAHVCPIHSVHFVFSVAALFSIAAYLGVRARLRVDAMGVLVGPVGLALLLGTYFLGKPGPEPRLSPVFIALHVMTTLLGIALFLLAGGAAALYLVQERRIKAKKLPLRRTALPPLDTLDHAVHRFLVAGFPLLTLGIISGTYWAQKLEVGSPEEVMRTIFAYATWLLIAGVLLLRAAAGWRGRRSAYGTLAGLFCAAAVLVIYLVRPATGVGG